MFIAMALFTVGYVGLKKVESDKAMHKRIVIFYTLGLIFVLGRLPWAAWL
jgi:hypothetical protein